MAVMSEASEHDGSADASLLLSMNARLHLDQAVSNALEQVAGGPTPVACEGTFSILVRALHVNIKNVELGRLY